MGNSKILSIVLVFSIFQQQMCQISFTELTKIGVIPSRNYKLKIKGATTTQAMVIKLIPNLSNLSTCNNMESVMNDYKDLLTRILKPINDSLTLVRSSVETRTTGLKFWGAVIGGVALGVATSAQITAAIALHKANQNAAMIQNLKNAILETNQAVAKLSAASSGIVLAISALQEQINANLVPSLNELGCSVALNNLKLQLNRYFSEISLIFGPNLRDPGLQTLSIQAVSQAFNGDFESMFNQLNYKRDDFLDLLQSDSIRGRIIDVDMTNYFISLQIEYPELIEITSAVIQEFNIISHNQKGTEWMAAFPRAVLKRGTFLSNIELKDCSRTDKSYICLEDTSTPMSPTMFECIQGKLENCARSLVVNSYVSRFALSSGVVFANCVPITCVCTTTNQHLIQDTSASNVMISSEDCKEVQVDGVFITVGPRKLNRTMYSQDIKYGPPISSNPIDVSNQLAKVEESIKESDEFIRRSNDILKMVNPSLVSTGVMVFLIISAVVLIIWILIIVAWLYKLTRQVNGLEYMRFKPNDLSTVSSMSSLIPGI
ncbi:fusion protein [Jingmen Miniopterus schreibersii paramyxovirus 1]|uniref:Fusion glycoprotein F0 n=1 Tax=Jingmen Miniopterus schreibersii paramyxovirus 1 TaxID=2877500 RepID=A0AAE8XRS1_9MONO|nr:fusion protein [Jingmen Miniopterus schreibersii paramyxovirus 1]